MPALYTAIEGHTANMTPHLLKRSLTVNHTQAVTLGVIAVYVVVIALLWNIPYVRWSLWPFKACENNPSTSGVTLEKWRGKGTNPRRRCS